MPAGIRLSYIGILIAIMYWPLEAAMHAWVFGSEGFLDKLFSSDPHELWMRFIISAILIGFGYLAQSMLDRQMVMQQQLKQKRDRLQQVIDTAYDAYISMDMNGRVTGWNRSAERLFGWSLQDALGQELASLIIPPEMREAHQRGMKKYLESSIGPWLYKPIRTQALCKNNQRIAVEMSVVPLIENGDQGFFSFIRMQEPE